MNEEICPECILLAVTSHFDILQRPGPDLCHYPSVLTRRCYIPSDHTEV